MRGGRRESEKQQENQKILSSSKVMRQPVWKNSRLFASIMVINIWWTQQKLRKTADRIFFSTLLITASSPHPPWVFQVELVVENLPANDRRHKKHGFNPWVRKIPWKRAWQPTPLFPRESQGQRILRGLQSIRTQRVGHD